VSSCDRAVASRQHRPGEARLESPFLGYLLRGESIDLRRNAPELSVNQVPDHPTQQVLNANRRRYERPAGTPAHGARQRVGG
jgi:hypothetical protein